MVGCLIFIYKYLLLNEIFEKNNQRNNKGIFT